MIRSITTLERLGRKDARLIVEQTKGMVEAKSVDDYLAEKTIVHIFTEPALAEYLCCAAAVRQMSGQAIFFPPKEAAQAKLETFPVKLLSAVSSYMDCLMVNGVETSSWQPEELVFPLINCGGPDAHPSRALADVACMMLHAGGELDAVKICWLGGITGELCSLAVAAGFFGLHLHVYAVPGLPLEQFKDLAARHPEADVVFAATKEEAVEGASYCFIGSREGLDYESLPRWTVSPSFLRGLKPNGQLLLGASPSKCLLLDMRYRRAGEGHSLLLKQAENRLKVYKRFFHYIFD